MDRVRQAGTITSFPQLSHITDEILFPGLWVQYSDAHEVPSVQPTVGGTAGARNLGDKLPKAGSAPPSLGQ